MSQSVSEAFIRKYEAEVHVAYQRRGSRLRDTIRIKNGVNAKSCTFQRVGKGTSSKKTRHGKVPVMNIDHSPVTIYLEDWYAGDYVDKLDVLKLNIDERGIVQQAGAMALGRRTDQIIINALSNTTNQIAVDYKDNFGNASETDGMNLSNLST